MIRVQGLTLNYGERYLFDNISFTVTKGEKLGITGRNGCGKSTLFKILTEQIKPDKGIIERPKEVTIGTLKQELPSDNGNSIKDEVLNSLEDLKSLNDELHNLEQLLSDPKTDEKKMMIAVERMHDIHHRLDYLNADKIEGEIEKILNGLGFTSDDFIRPTHEFSGGWRMRVELAKLLLQKPDILLLDEPNNHLDIISIQWLEKYLISYEGTVMIISHDLMLVDKVAKRIIEVDRGRLYDFKGTYSDYINYRKERKEIEQNEYNAQQKVIQHKEMLIDKFRAKANKASFAKSLQSELARMDIMDEPMADQGVIRLRFNTCNQSGRVVFETKNLKKAYGEKVVLDQVNMLVERGQKLSFIGQNGQGKSTMVKLISKSILPTHGEILKGHQVRIGYYAQEHTELLSPSETILEAVEHASTPEARVNIRRILGGLAFRDEDIDKRISVLSGGEKSRVRLAMLLVQDHNVLILDEPTHHLDIPSKEVLKDAINNYKGTIIIVSHDREFLRGLAEKTFYFANKEIKEFHGDIDYFLEKTNSESLQETFKAVVKPKNDLAVSSSEEDKKKLKRKLDLIEVDISKLEKKISDLESKMSDSEFYTSKESSKIMDEYKKLKISLEAQNGQWEAVFNLLS
ncbi:MAG: ABC-F family ATP-binding cassette domain-containing protein [Saprospiraceae bacterium]|nr:ABC-F family ATP-binding cassette domain-containing protein [Saprospiraceae bacterium]